jgi:tetratricopeptide (TPR) repeat protein
MAAKDVPALAREAERLLRIGRASEAERVCKSILKSVPDQPKALMISSSIFMAAGRWAEAEAALLSGCAAHPRSAIFHAALGRLRLQLNQHAQAVAPLENCVLLEPRVREHRVTLLGLYQLRRFASFSEASLSRSDPSLARRAAHGASAARLRRHAHVNRRRRVPRGASSVRAEPYPRWTTVGAIARDTGSRVDASWLNVT